MESVRKAVKKEASKAMAGNPNRPLDLLLQRKMIKTYKHFSGVFLSKLTPYVDEITVDKM